MRCYESIPWVESGGDSREKETGGSGKRSAAGARALFFLDETKERASSAFFFRRYTIFLTFLFASIIKLEKSPTAPPPKRR